MTDPHRGVESLPVNDQSLLVVVMTSHFHARTMILRLKICMRQQLLWTRLKIHLALVPTS